MFSSKTLLIQASLEESALNESQLQECLGMSSEQFIRDYEADELSTADVIIALDKVSQMKEALSTSVHVADEDDSFEGDFVQWGISQEEIIDDVDESVETFNILRVGDSAMVLTEPIRKQLFAALKDLDPNKPKPKKSLNDYIDAIIRWWDKHKIFGTLTAAFVALIIVSVIYGFIKAGGSSLG